MVLPLVAISRWFWQRKPIYSAINALSAASEARLSAIEVGATSQVVVTEFNPAPAATSTTALHAALATTVADQTILAAAMVAGGKTALATYPRTVTYTIGGTAADGPTSVVFVGTDASGAPLTETQTNAPSAATFETVNAFASLTSYTCKGATATDATVAVGLGSTFSTRQKIKKRADRYSMLQEVYSASGTGVVLTTGVIVAPATCVPYGGYTPAAAPDGTRKYSLTFEHDLT